MFTIDVTLKTTFSLLLGILFALSPLYSQNNCPADAPASFDVEYVGADCYLTFTWPANEMPELACGTPGTPAPGSTPLKGKLIDLLLNGSELVYDNGNNCSGSTFNLTYHPSIPDTYITTTSHCFLATQNSIIFRMNRTGGSNFDCELFSASSLPVELVDFQGDMKNDYIQLEWITDTEQNNSHFDIEHSPDGREFTKIGTVEGMGNSTVRHTYHFTDRSPVAENNYYRLRQVDFDGHHDYSPIIMVKNTQQDYFAFFPTRIEQKGTVQLRAEREGKLAVQVFNLVGQKMITESFWVQHGLNTLELDLNRLHAGAYFATLEGAGQHFKPVYFSKHN